MPTVVKYWNGKNWIDGVHPDGTRESLEEKVGRAMATVQVTALANLDSFKLVATENFLRNDDDFMLIGGMLIGTVLGILSEDDNRRDPLDVSKKMGLDELAISLPE